MASPFAVYITARFERDYRSLLKQHPELAADYATVVSILSTEPHNRTRKRGGQAPILLVRSVPKAHITRAR